MLIVGRCVGAVDRGQWVGDTVEVGVWLRVKDPGWRHIALLEALAVYAELVCAPAGCHFDAVLLLFERCGP